MVRPQQSGRWSALTFSALFKPTLLRCRTGDSWLICILATQQIRDTTQSINGVGSNNILLLR